MEKKLSPNDVKVYCRGDRYKIQTANSLSGVMDLAMVCNAYHYLTGQILSAYDINCVEWPAFELAAR